MLEPPLTDLLDDRRLDGDLEVRTWLGPELDPMMILGSAAVGLLVGMTGAGGGALMTPMLMLLFGVPALRYHLERDRPGRRTCVVHAHVATAAALTSSPSRESVGSGRCRESRRIGRGDEMLDERGGTDPSARC